MAQLVEHILGKDEVPGPNPGSSSKQPRGLYLGALVFIGLLAAALCKGLFRAATPCFVSVQALLASGFKCTGI